MKVVKFLKTVEDGQVESGKVVLGSNGIRYEGLNDGFIESLESGILGQYGKRYKPSDGIEFLENLKYEFTGSYLRATDIIEEP